MKAGLGFLLILSFTFMAGWWLRGEHVVEEPATRVPTYTATVDITGEGDEEFVAFLDDSLGRVVFISTFLDISVSIESQQNVADQFDVHAFTEDASTWLPLSPDGAAMLALALLDGRELPISHGGTGIVKAECIGYFLVTSTVHAGPSMTYRLREIPLMMPATNLPQ